MTNNYKFNEMKLGGFDFLSGFKLRWIRLTKARIERYNASHKAQIAYTVMGGGISIRRVL